MTEEDFPYLGPVEALKPEAAAMRLGISLDTLREQYDGPISYLGSGQSNPVYPAFGLHNWLVSRSMRKGAAKDSGGFGSFGNGAKDKKQEGVRARPKRQAG